MKYKPLIQADLDIPAECSITSGEDEYLVKGKLGISIDYHKDYGFQISYDVWTYNKMKKVIRKAKNSKYTRGQIFYSPVYTDLVCQAQKDIYVKAISLLSKKESLCKFRSDLKECEKCNEI